MVNNSVDNKANLAAKLRKFRLNLQAKISELESYNINTEPLKNKAKLSEVDTTYVMNTPDDKAAKPTLRIA